MPTSNKTSPTFNRTFDENNLKKYSNKKNVNKVKKHKSYELLCHLQEAIKEKDKELSSLRSYVADVQPRLELISSRNGQIEVGLGN